MSPVGPDRKSWVPWRMQREGHLHVETALSHWGHERGRCATLAWSQTVHVSDQPSRTTNLPPPPPPPGFKTQEEVLKRACKAVLLLFVYMRFLLNTAESHFKVVLCLSERRCISKWGGMRRDRKPTDVPGDWEGTCHSRSRWIAAALAEQIDWEYREQLAEGEQEGDWGNHQVASVNYDTVHPDLSISYVLVGSGSVMTCLHLKRHLTPMLGNITQRLYHLVRNQSCSRGLIGTIWITFFTNGQRIIQLITASKSGVRHEYW